MADKSTPPALCSKEDMLFKIQKITQPEGITSRAITDLPNFPFSLDMTVKDLMEIGLAKMIEMIKDAPPDDPLITEMRQVFTNTSQMTDVGAYQTGLGLGAKFSAQCMAKEEAKKKEKELTGQPSGQPSGQPLKDSEPSKLKDDN